HYETDPEGAENASPKKAGFGKSESDTVADLKDKLAEALKEKQEYLDKWQRGMAEFQNARKRDAEDNDRFRKFATESVIADLLPVLESFNMAFSNKEAWEKVDSNWRTGVEYIAGQLKSTLESNGLKELNPLGEKFDPMLHEAVAYDEVDSKSKDHVITEVVNKGYELQGRVLKAPKVKVGEFKKENKE
ncbi:MAG: nucleotide exchange factor GrpE, partial [Candidatus Taylorbacteria bacterium]|nr:nucleotide exchange factor GrpE [Candidatus Taylorbacteria bacterium]